MLKRSANPPGIGLVPTRDKRLHGLVCLPHLPLLTAQDDGMKIALTISLPDNLIGRKRIRANAEQRPPDAFGNSRSDQGTSPIFKFVSNLNEILSQFGILLNTGPRKRPSCISIVWKQNPFMRDHVHILPDLLCRKRKEKFPRQMRWLILEHENRIRTASIHTLTRFLLRRQFDFDGAKISGISARRTRH